MAKLQFIKNTDIELVSRKLAEDINAHLRNGQHVLWLVSGGSAVHVAVNAGTKIATDNRQGLTVGLIDERFGPVGHPDSNWQQLITAGFKLDGSHLKPVLHDAGLDETATEYDSFITSTESNRIYKVGLLGIGADGHTAGLLPNSRAIDSDKYVGSYAGPDFMRITLTAKGLGLLDRAFVFVTGEAKRQALENLMKDIDPADQPAQLLKQIGKVEIYNEVMGEKI